MRYEFEIAIRGRVIVGIEADSFEEAERLANEEVTEMDFGELSDIEWEAISAESEDGKYKEY